MHRVEVAVELQHLAGPAGGEAHHHRRRRGVAGDGALDGETVGGEDARQPIGDGAALAGSAGYGDELRGGVEQALALDGVAKTVAEGGRLHEGTSGQAL